MAAAGPVLRGVLPHFATGGLIAVVAVDLLGDIDDRSPIATVTTRSKAFIFASVRFPDSRSTAIRRG